MVICFQDPYALNEVVLGHTSEGYRIDEGTTAKTTKAFTMSLTVPSIAGSSGRVYPLAADDDHQWKLWLDAFRRVMAWLPGQDEAGPIENGSHSPARVLPPSPGAPAHHMADRDLPPIPPPRPDLPTGADKNPSPVPSPRPAFTLPRDFGGTQLGMCSSGRYAQDY